MQKSECSVHGFLRNLNLKVFPYKNQSSKMDEITKASFALDINLHKTIVTARGTFLFLDEPSQTLCPVGKN